MFVHPKSYFNSLKTIITKNNDICYEFWQQQHYCKKLKL
jgi:hypothetical protein